MKSTLPVVLFLTFLLFNLLAPGTGFAQSFIVDGYTDKFSYAHGETIKVYINASQPDPAMKFLLYDVSGNRVDSVTAIAAPQPVNNDDPYRNGYGYQQTFSYVVPNYLKSGIYSWKNKIAFIIKSEGKRHDIVVLFESNRKEAYNSTGGKSLYGFNSPGGKSNTVSFLRPKSNDAISSFSIPFMQWLNSYHLCNVGYICDMDMDDYSEIEQAKLLIITGCSEYWTREARLNFDRFNNAGKNVLILAGNTMYWQVRYSDDKNQLICYKDLRDDHEPDPLLQTINWSESSLQYSVLKSIGVDYDHGGRADDSTMAMVGWKGMKITNTTLPFFKNTGLTKGQVISCRTHEYDGSLISGYDADNFPILDTVGLGFYKIELAGFDLAQGPKMGTGCWISMQKSATSGKIINVGTTNWTSETGIGGPDSLLIRKITENMINLMMDDSLYMTPPAMLNICGSSSVCRGDSTTLFASGDGSFLWSTGSTTSYITVAPTAVSSYTVTITDNSGNVNSLTTEVSVNENPAMPVLSNNLNTLICSGPASHYQWFYNGKLIPSSDTNAVLCGESGNFTVIITNDNGCRAVSEPLLVNCSTGVSISPNPMQQTATIRFKSNIEEAWFELYDGFGRMVKKQHLYNPESIMERGNLNNGIYHYRIMSEEGMVYTGKLILL